MDTKDLGTMFAKMGPLAVQLVTAQTDREFEAALNAMRSEMDSLTETEATAMAELIASDPGMIEAIGFAAGQAAARGEAPEFRDALAVTKRAIEESASQASDPAREND